MKRQRVQVVAAANATVALSLLLVSCAGNPQKAKLKYLDKGKAYMDKAQYASATIEFRNALKVDPRYVEAYFQLTKAYLHEADADSQSGNRELAAQDGRDAYSALRQAISLDPKRVDLRLERASLLLPVPDDKLHAQAMDDINFVLQQDPQNVEAHRLLGTDFVRQKQYDRAFQEFSKASALAPKDPNIYVDIALADMAHVNAIQLDPDANTADAEQTIKNATADAEQNIRKAIQADPQDIAAYNDLAGVYQVQRDPDQAEQAFQAGIKANPSNPSAIPLYLNLATLLESQGKQPDAENALTGLSNALPKSADAALAIGDFYLNVKMNVRALAEYKRGLSVAPQNIVIKERIEDLYLTDGQIDQAATFDGELLKQAPNDVLVRVNHGRVLLAQGKVSDAIQSLQKVAADSADSPEAHYYLGRAYWLHHDLAQANSEFQQTLRVSPSSRIALIALVELNASQQRYSVAQLYAQELVDNNPKEPSAHVLLGRVFFKLNQVKQAGDEFATAEKLDLNSPDPHMALASLYLAENPPRVSDADKEFQAALHTAPGNSSIVADYAQFLLNQKQQAKAIALITQFLAQNPNQSGAHLLMGEVYTLEKNYSAALSETQKSLQLDSKNQNAYSQMGQIYRDQKNNSAAIQAYEQTMTLGPSAQIATVIGSIYIDEGDLSQASNAFQKALAIDPNFVIAANNLAWIYAEQGQNLDVALGLAQKAVAQQPGVPDFSDTLAWVMFRRGNHAGALPLLQDCIKKEPGNAQYHFHLGMVLVADGQKTEGKAQLQEALNIKSPNIQNNLDSQDADQARKALSQ